MNETMLDKETYQTNGRLMCWAASGVMIACSVTIIYDPARMATANNIFMAQYLALSGLLCAYFALKISAINLWID